MSGEPKRVRLVFAVPKVITLTEGEVRHGALEAVFRQSQNLTIGRLDRNGCGLDGGWDKHINGALGEIAAARAVGRYWEGMGALGNLRARDVLGAQVRWTSGTELRIMKSDPPDDPFILVTGRAPKFTVWGWLRAREGQRHEYLSDKGNGRPPCYFVPRDDLHDLDLLPEAGCPVREPGEEG